MHLEDLAVNNIGVVDVGEILRSVLSERLPHLVSLVDNPEHPEFDDEVENKGSNSIHGLSTNERIAKANHTQNDSNQLPNVILDINPPNHCYAVKVAEIPSLLRSHTANGHVDENQTNDGAAQTNQLKEGKHVNSLHVSHHRQKLTRSTTHNPITNESTQPAEQRNQERAEGNQERAEDNQERAEGKQGRAEDKQERAEGKAKQPEQAEGKHSFQNDNLSSIKRVYPEPNIRKSDFSIILLLISKSTIITIKWVVK